MASANDLTKLEKVYNVVQLFAGIGGGSLGFKNARFNWRGIPGRFKNILAIDCDYGACQSYKRLVGSKVEHLDLFSREQYTRFHGKEPPPEWKEITPADIRTLCGDELPDGVFTSPPCKGLSGLLPTESANSDKYQALNELTVRGIRLMLEAYADKPLKFILFENVPRIKSRGKALLEEIERLLKSHGYTIDMHDHDCGEIGGLGQRRKRFLLIARHKATFKPFIYKPELKPLKTIGDVIGSLPLPDDTTMGPMHRLPRLKWLTWLRLALIPAGGDWRDLRKIAPEEYRLAYEPRSGGPWGVQGWDKPGSTVTGSSSVKGSNATSIADPRVPDKGNRHHSHFKITGFEEPGGTVTGASHVANGAACISDPRLSESKGTYPGRFGVRDWDNHASCITGDTDVQCGAQSIADPRLKESENRHNNKFRVSSTNDPAPCVTGTRFGSGALAFSDVRLNHLPRPGVYRILRMEEASGAITGGQGVGLSNGPSAIADTRLNTESRSGYLQVIKMSEPAPTITGSSRVTGSNGPAAVADHRLGCAPRGGSYGVMGWSDTSPAVIGHADCHAAKVAVADIRIPDNNERLDPPPVIIALDGAWHRPLTTLELAVLQSLPTHFEDGAPLVLHGNSDSKWREWIGNMVPPKAAETIAEAVGIALLQNELGDTFTLGTTGIWVEPGNRQPAVCPPIAEALVRANMVESAQIAQASAG